ncbi:glycosyltransferase family 4 protein [Thermodesulfobacteriota bacterium]
MLADVFYPDTIGGAGRVAYHLGLELSKMGHEVHILTRNPERKYPSHQNINPNLHIHRFDTPDKESLTLLYSEIKNSYYLSKQLAYKIKFDIICIHQSMAAIGPFLSRSFKNIPSVHYFHSPWHEEFLIKKQGYNTKKQKITVKLIAYLMKWIEKRVINKSSKVIVLSRYMRNKVRATHNFPQNRIITIHGGVDLDNFKLHDKNKTILKKNKRLHGHKTIFLTIRNLVPRMGLENLIKAFYQSETLQNKSELLIGGRGPLEDHLKDMVEKFNLKNSIHFLGRIPEEDLPKTYQTADFFVLPTEKLEGFGLVIAESMACGTPVLGTPVGAIPELLGAFDKRLLFKGSSSEDLKKLMEEVVNKPEEYSYSRESCRKFAEDNFSWNRVAALFEEAIQNLA